MAIVTLSFSCVSAWPDSRPDIPTFGKLWQADTCYLPHITENGRRRRVYCIMIIDDHSRLLVGGGLFYNDTSYNFQKVLKAAVATYGIPMKLYVDNGSTYSNEQLSLICGSQMDKKAIDPDTILAAVSGRNLV